MTESTEPPTDLRDRAADVAFDALEAKQRAREVKPVHTFTDMEAVVDAVLSVVATLTAERDALGDAAEGLRRENGQLASDNITLRRERDAARTDYVATGATLDHATDRLSDMVYDAGLARPENLAAALDAVATLVRHMDQQMVRDLHAAQFDGSTLLPDRPLDTTWVWLLDLVRKDRARLSAPAIPDDAAGLDSLLGIDRTDPVQQAALDLVEATGGMMAALVAARHESGLTQAEVGRRMGIKQPAVHQLERVDSDPKLSTVRRYALAVGVRVEFRVAPSPSAPQADGTAELQASSNLLQPLEQAGGTAEPELAVLRAKLQDTDDACHCVWELIPASRRKRTYMCHAHKARAALGPEIYIEGEDPAVPLAGATDPAPAPSNKQGNNIRPFVTPAVSSEDATEPAGDAALLAVAEDRAPAPVQTACEQCGGTDITYQSFSAGREYYCSDCDDCHPYREGQAPPRVQMIASASDTVRSAEPGVDTSDGGAS